MYWGDEATDGWWFDDIHRFAAPRSSGGLSALVQLTRAPATLLLYAAGVAAVAAGRWPLVGRLLTEPQTLDPRSGQQRRVAEILGPTETLTLTGASRWLYDRLSPLFAEQLSLGGAAYTDAWECFEYLRLVARTDHGLRTRGGRSSDVPHIRADGSDDNQPVVADWLAQQLDHHGQEHPLLRAGVCDGDLPRLREAMAAYNEDFRNFANNRAASKLGGGGGLRFGVLPSGFWYPDETLSPPT